jgi:alanyl-tRNA synthetase
VTGNEIRETFLRFFEEKGHKRVRSSSLVPVNDPTLLFTNAGMNQFKDVFLGLEQRDYKRATTSQKCVRAGGKHNDLENVGFTNRHHTFFEMLGNFSFGDYFKKDAVAFAWELITSPKWYAVPLDKLYFTVFGGAEVSPGKTIGTDEEAAELWEKIGAPKDRIFAIPGLKENFWAMGDTGPCGPCSEIHYDMGPAASDAGHTDCKFPCDCGRYVEIWNLVFMQFNRDSSGELNPLPKPSVDTGMGLERVAAVLLNMQDPSKFSNYDTDLFQSLMKAAWELVGRPVFGNVVVDPSLRIIADHIRACTFLICDGVTPSNEGRGYVLKKIMRRGIQQGRVLGTDKPFFHKLVSVVVSQMSGAYPELRDVSERATTLIRIEEERFSRTLSSALSKLNEYSLQAVKDSFAQNIFKVHSLQGVAQSEAMTVGEAITDPPTGKIGEVVRRATMFMKDRVNVTIPFAGRKAFYLFDTMGLPKDFIEDALHDLGLVFDTSGFQAALEDQRDRAKASWKGRAKEAAPHVYLRIGEIFHTEPDFYFGLIARDCKVEAIIKAGGIVTEIIAGEEAELILDRSSIYAESGGQVADIGKLYDNGVSIELATVKGAYYPISGLIAHRVTAIDTIHVGDRVATVADGARREHIKRNHTATHLMNAALRNILGTHVKQAGSLVEPGRLRFDFSHFAPVDAAELKDIEQQVNEEILLNNELETNIMPLDEALASGALAFFGDRYPESNVRVVTIPDSTSPRGFFSKELCGGTHVKRSGDIGIFKIIGESSVAAGVRRVEAISGVRALEEYQRAADSIRSIAAGLNVGPEEIEATTQKLIEGRRELEKQLNSVQKKSAQGSADELIAQARDVKGVRLVAARVPDMSREALRGLVDTLKQKLGSGVIALGMVEAEKVALIVGVTKDLTAKCNAGKIIQAIAKEVGGSGGGRPDLAEAGGKDTSALNMALDTVPAILERML